MNRSDGPSLEIIAPTVEAAVAQGLAELNLPADAVSVEVLDGGSRGLLGLGGRQARVRLTVKVESAGHVPSSYEEGPSFEGTDEVLHRTQNEAGPSFDGTDELLRRTEGVVSAIIEKMGIDAQVTSRFGDADEEGRKTLHVDLSGDDLAVLIGRRAEILNALQYLVSLIVGKQMNQWVHVMVDVEGYRLRHENQLRHMAQRVAEQAIRTGRRQVLEPMPAADRRIIHIELRDNPQVTTQSIGDEPARKVTILPNSY